MCKPAWTPRGHFGKWEALAQWFPGPSENGRSRNGPAEASPLNPSADSDLSELIVNAFLVGIKIVAADPSLGVGMK